VSYLRPNSIREETASQMATRSLHRFPSGTDMPTGARPEQEVWRELQSSARALVTAEPALADHITKLLLAPANLAEALVMRFTTTFADSPLRSTVLRDLASRTLADDSEIVHAAAADLLAIRACDPAAEDLLTPFVFFKGFVALSFQRIAHRLWLNDRRAMAMLMQHCLAMKMNIDLHPGAVFGEGILLDHAGGIVVGETAVVGDDVTIFHNVTLGGTGKQRGDRHPKIGRGVFVGAGAHLLGNIRVGEWSRIGAGSVVLDNVPAFSIAVGVPAHSSQILLNSDWQDPRVLEAMETRRLGEFAASEMTR
jgi:serine O-acetyltransferase